VNALTGASQVVGAPLSCDATRYATVAKPISELFLRQSFVLGRFMESETPESIFFNFYCFRT